MTKHKIPRENDIKRLVCYLSEISFDYKIQPDEFGYDNPVLVCIDAVLSINRKYNSFVIPRIKNFQENHPNICTLNQVDNIIQKLGYEGFHIMWNYKHSARVKTLDHLINKFINYARQIKETDDLAAMKTWAKTSKVVDYQIFGVYGIGLATFQYLRMMLGISTVKPDVHIKRAVTDALKRPVSDLETIALIEEASEAMGLTATFVDHNLWRNFSTDRKLSI